MISIGLVEKRRVTDELNELIFDAKHCHMIAVGESMGLFRIPLRLLFEGSDYAPEDIEYVVNNFEKTPIYKRGGGIAGYLDSCDGKYFVGHLA